MTKYTFRHKIITLKRRIYINDKLKQKIFKNINYRRYVWNKFVENWNDCKHKNIKFDAFEFKKSYFNNFELPNEIYKDHIIGISEQVSKDIISALKIAKTNHGKLRYKRFNPHIGSFKVHCKPNYYSPKDCNIKMKKIFKSRLLVIDQNLLLFRANEKYKKDYWYIHLMEPLYHDVIPVNDEYVFCDKNHHMIFKESHIKEISFIHELNKFYVSLTLDVIYINDINGNISNNSNCGIDLGIRNPLTLYDGNNTQVISLTNKELNRIRYLERRIGRLQKILSKKVYGSNNYYRLLRKICVSSYKIRNIRLNWRRKVTNLISKKYSTIVVDPFNTPTKKDHLIQNKLAIKKINHYNRMHGMFQFNRLLNHMVFKNGSNYILAPENTTCKCSNCGYINKHLKLSDIYLVCDNCGTKINRDINAAKNCYNYIASLAC